MKSNRVLYYDLIKITAAFMVCFYHLSLLDVGTVTNSFYIPNFNKLLLNFCAMSVPLFFMVNGALMLRRAYSLKEIVWRFLKTVFLYYFWVIVIGALGERFFGVKQLSILEILDGYRNQMTVHLWFFRTIAILSLLTPMLKKLYEEKYRKLLSGFMLCIFLFPFLYNYVLLFLRWKNIAFFESFEVTGAATMYSVLYFLLGKIISDRSAEQTGNCTKYRIIAVICILTGWLLVSMEVTLWSNLQGSVYDGVNSSFPTIGALLMATGVFYLFSKNSVKWSDRGIEFIERCAGNIMGIYILHPIFIRVALRIVHRAVPVFAALGICIIIMLITVIIADIMKKLPIVKRLFVI